MFDLDKHRGELDLRNLNTFIEVIELRSIPKASKSLNVSSVTIHNRLNALRNSLQLSKDDALFERHGQGGSLLVPTYLGKVLFEQGLMLQRHISDTLQDIRKAKERRPVVRVGIQNSIHRVLAREITAYFQREHENNSSELPRLSFRAERPEILIEELEAGLLDIAVTMIPRLAKPQLVDGFELECLYNERIVLVSSDPACNSLEDIALPKSPYGWRMVFVNWGEEFNHHVQNTFSTFGETQFNYEYNRTTGALTLLFDNEQPHYCAGFFPIARIAEYFPNEVNGDASEQILRIVGNGHALQREVAMVSRISEFKYLDGDSSREGQDDFRLRSTKRKRHFDDAQRVKAAIREGKKRILTRAYQSLPDTLASTFMAGNDCGPDGQFS